MNLNEFIFGKKKKKKKLEEPVEEVNWEEETPKQPLPEKLKKTKKKAIEIPKGKALINVNKKSWLHIIMGAILVIVNIIFFGIGTVGWMTRVEEKILVTLYALPSIYVTMMFTWMKIQGQTVEDLDDE